MSMITSSPPTKAGVHPPSVADFQFAFQALSQQPFPSIPKNIASISIPQPLTRLSPQPPSSLYLPATVATPDVGKKPAQRSLKGGNRSRNSTNDKVKKRLARKAELARASRRRKKAYIQDLEDKVNRLTQQVLTLQRERALLGLPSTLASSTFTPISSSPRSSKNNSNNSDDSDSGDNEKEKNSHTYETSELESTSGSSNLSTNENNTLMVDGLSGLASAASRLANMEDLLELGGNKTGTETKTVSSPVKTEGEEDGESDQDKCEEEIKPKNKKVPSPSTSVRTAGSGNFTVDPNLPLSVFALSQPTSQPTPPTVPVPIPSRSLTTSSSTAPLSSHSPPMSSSFLSTSRVSAFTNTRQGKQESGNNERCIKASYNGDTRRFSLTEKNFSFTALVQTLRETYQNLPSSFTIKYRDEEQDYINITTTAEFREAYRLLCLTPLSPSSPTSQTPSTPPQKILKLIIESNQSSPMGTTTKLKNKNGTSNVNHRKKGGKNHSNSSSNRGNKRKTSVSTSSSESTTTLSSLSSSPPSPLKKQRHREIPLPPKFPSTSFPIFLQGVDTNIDEHSTIPPFCLIVDSSMTIEQLKNDIAKMQPSLSAGVYYQYSYHGQILDDNNKYIKDYGITKGSVIRLDRIESIAPPRFYPSFMLPSSSTPTTATSSTSTMEIENHQNNNPLSNPLSFFFPQILPLLSTAATTFSESTPAITSGFSFPQLDLSSTTIATPMSSEYDTKQPRSTEYDTKLPRSTEYDTKQPRSTEYDAKQPRSMEYDMKRNKNNSTTNGINITNQPQSDSTCATLISSIKYPLMGSTPSLPVLLGA